MSINTKLYIEEYLVIADKNAALVPLKLNAPQMKLYDAIKRQHEAGKPVRVIVLKARQLGFSTLVEAILFKAAATGRNINGGIVAHKEDATTNLFKMSKRFHDNLPPPLQPVLKASNAKELVFEDLKSGIRCMTAGGVGIGRSDTYQNLHISEYAFWKGDKAQTLLGLLQAVPAAPGTVVVIESTANGFDDFKDLWDKAVAGENDFVPVFCAWHEMADYRKPYDGFKLTDEEKALKKRYRLDNDQLAWRRWCIANNCGGDTDLFRQEYPASPHEAFIFTGSSVFDNEIVLRRLQDAPKPVRTGRFEYDYDGLRISNIRFVDDAKGFVKVYREPQENVPYVIGGDTAGDGSDSFTGQVLDNMTGKQVAVLRHQFDEDLYTRQMYCLGMWYNTALMGIEVNFSRFPVKEMERLRYPRQYRREHMDSYTGKMRKSYGFHTSPLTRPVAVAGLVQAFREQPDIVEDAETLEEMLTFARNEAGKAEAISGKHDDLVMGLAIAHAIRGQQSMVKREPRKKTDNEYGEFLSYGT